MELISEAMIMRISKGIGTSSMNGDKPFLIYLKKRGATLPYLVMWIDNSELLTKWE